MFEDGLARQYIGGQVLSEQPILRHVQTISTIPKGWPQQMNTCGRITVHKNGDYVLCSNRGHDSIASFHVHQNSNPPGLLSLATIQHTHGATPRHFAFDPSGQWLIAANQVRTMLHHATSVPKHARAHAPPPGSVPC